MLTKIAQVVDEGIKVCLDRNAVEAMEAFLTVIFNADSQSD